MPRPKTQPAILPAELRVCIEECGGFTQVAEKTGIPYRSLQEYASGKRGTPAEVADQLRALQAEWAAYWREWRKGLAARIDREFPEGIR